MGARVHTISSSLTGPMLLIKMFVFTTVGTPEIITAPIDGDKEADEKQFFIEKHPESIISRFRLQCFLNAAGYGERTNVDEKFKATASQKKLKTSLFCNFLVKVFALEDGHVMQTTTAQLYKKKLPN